MGDKNHDWQDSLSEKFHKVTNDFGQELHITPKGEDEFDLKYVFKNGKKAFENHNRNRTLAIIDRFKEKGIKEPNMENEKKSLLRAMVEGNHVEAKPAIKNRLYEKVGVAISAITADVYKRPLAEECTCDTDDTKTDDADDIQTQQNTLKNPDNQENLQDVDALKKSGVMAESMNNHSGEEKTVNKPGHELHGKKVKIVTMQPDADGHTVINSGELSYKAGQATFHKFKDNELMAEENDEYAKKYPLHHAAHTGDLETIKKHMAFGCAHNQVTPQDIDNDGNSPLHKAIQGGHMDILKHMIGEKD